MDPRCCVLTREREMTEFIDVVVVGRYSAGKESKEIVIFN